MKPILKQRLRNGQLTVGTWMQMAHPAIAEILARAGFDWIVIDLEHSTIGTERAGELIRTIDLCGVTPLVRLPSKNPEYIGLMLDAGAHGIIVPMVNSADEAARAVAATRFAPQGTRGVGLARAQGYGTRFREHFAWQEDGPVVMVQIEHATAVEKLDEILAVPGVDGLMVGPYDLTCSMGIAGEFQHPAYRAALKRILETGKRMGIPVGIHVVEPDVAELEGKVQAGYQFIAYSVDFRMLDVAARRGAAFAATVSR